MSTQDARRCARCGAELAGDEYLRWCRACDAEVELEAEGGGVVIVTTGDRLSPDAETLACVLAKLNERALAGDERAREVMLATLGGVVDEWMRREAEAGRPVTDVAEALARIEERLPRREPGRGARCGAALPASPSEEAR